MTEPITPERLDEIEEISGDHPNEPGFYEPGHGVDRHTTIALCAALREAWRERDGLREAKISEGLTVFSSDLRRLRERAERAEAVAVARLKALREVATGPCHSVEIAMKVLGNPAEETETCSESTDDRTDWCARCLARSLVNQASTDCCGAELLDERDALRVEVNRLKTEPTPQERMEMIERMALASPESAGGYAQGKAFMRAMLEPEIERLRARVDELEAGP